MAKWPPFNEAFPALAGDWPGKLRQAIEARDSAAVSAICSELGVLTSLAGEVAPAMYSSLVWLLRSEKIRSMHDARTVMHFFTVNQDALSDIQKARIAWRLTKWGEPGLAEMVFDPMAGLH